jgi:hypothetical protein
MDIKAFSTIEDSEPPKQRESCSKGVIVSMTESEPWNLSLKSTEILRIVSGGPTTSQKTFLTLW